MSNIFSEKGRIDLADGIYRLLEDLDSAEVGKGKIAFELKVAGKRPWTKGHVKDSDSSKVFEKKYYRCDCGCGMTLCGEDPASDISRKVLNNITNNDKNK